LSQAAKPADAPSGAQVESLANIAASQGLPADFANSWGLPPTAVYGTPNNQDNGIPEPANPKGAAGAAAATPNQ
jgi:hypothetical protein